MKKFLKYWEIIAFLITLTGSIIVGAAKFANRLDKDEDSIKDSQEWVADHDQAIVDLNNRIIKLEEDQRLQERHHD